MSNSPAAAPDPCRRHLEDLDRICDQFDEAWLKDRQPRIEDYLEQLPADHRPELLQKLLAVELRHRWRRGEVPTSEEYCGRFPQSEPLVQAAFDRTMVPGDTGLSFSLHADAAVALVPTGLSVDEFVSRLIDSGLMSADEVRAFVAGVSQDGGPQDAEWLARELVEARKLTAYQARTIYKGRGRSLVLGNYIVLDKLGQGGMGLVLKALHHRMDRIVALKGVSPGIVQSPELLQRFQREVRAAARLNHQNIVAAYDADEVDGMHYLVMEYVEGEDLSRLVKRRGVLPVGTAVDYIQQAARGLEYAHKHGVIHRDIKPSNLLLDRSGTVKVLDMGLARIDGTDKPQDDLTNTGAVMGTIDYMAPEQAEDTHHADARADIYSLGCSLFYLLGGRPLYEGDTVVKKLFAHRDQPIPCLQSVAQGVSDELEAVFHKMLAKRPAERYQTMSEVVAELERCRTSADSSAPLHSPSSGDSRLDTFLEQLETGALPGPSKYRATGTHVQPAVPELSATVNVQSADLDTNPQTQTYAATNAAAPNGGRGGRRGAPLWSLACGGLAACLLLGGIVIRITTQDGKTTEIEVPEGAKVEVVGKPMPAGKTEDETAPAVPKSPDRLFDATRARSAAEAQAVQQAWAKRLGRPVIERDNALDMELVLIPPGEYLRGSPDSDSSASGDEKPQHRVRLTQAFYLGKTEVTQAQWHQLMGTTPWKRAGSFAKAGGDYPATCVTWEDATAFCTKLTEQERRAGRLPADWEYTLPTEAQWEYACRAGTTTKYSFGDEASELGNYAWFYYNAYDIGEKYAHEVGRKRPNAWGLFDMHGNVWEWCLDWHDKDEYERFRSQTAEDPEGRQPAGGNWVVRVSRGGSCSFAAKYNRSAHRNGNPPSAFFSVQGFRVAQVPSSR